MNSLGIDFGTKHMGIAIATGPLAEPIATLSTASAITELQKIIANHHITTVIVGLGDERLTEDLNLFLKKLQAHEPHLACHIVDETLTSKDARASLLHTSQTRRRQHEHAVAAALILQSWIDQKNLAI